MPNPKDPNFDAQWLNVEYEGRLVVIPRTSNYDELIACLKRIFKSLQPIPSDRIAVTACDEVEKATVEIVDFLWASYHHKISRIGIKIQGSANAGVGDKQEPVPQPKVPQSNIAPQPDVSRSQTKGRASGNDEYDDEYIDVESIDEPLANQSKRAREDETQGLETRAEQARKGADEDEDEYEDEVDDQYDDDMEDDDSNYGSDTNTAPTSRPTKRRRTRRFPTLPIQPRVWGKIRRKDVLRITYTGGDEPMLWKRILVNPETTVEDLKGFIESRFQATPYVGEGDFTYIYGSDGTLMDERTAGEILQRADGWVIDVHVPGPDSIFNPPEHFIRAVMNAGR
ncbi:hypothetical protein FRC07_010411 [Ceratobasidium sp. 392]|nr:hypothetical protein FRC07_010411 [Ceratobasidium sp. 392]